jgi:hypothetical protein
MVQTVQVSHFFNKLKNYIIGKEMCLFRISFAAVVGLNQKNLLGAQNNSSNFAPLFCVFASYYCDQIGERRKNIFER